MRRATLRYAAVLAVAALGLAGCGSLSAATQSGAPAASSFPTDLFPTIGHLAAWDATTGKTRWTVVLPIASVSAPVTAAGVIVVAGTRDCNLRYLTVVAYRVATGKRAWLVRVPTADPCGYLTPLHLSGGVVIAGGPIESTQGLGTSCSAAQPRSVPAVGLDPATGHKRWTEPASGGAILGATSSVVITDGTGFPCLSGFSGATGKTRWARADPNGEPQLTAGGAGVFQNAVSGKDVIRALDPTTGRLRWSRSVSGRGFFDSLVIAGNVVADVATKSVFDPAVRTSVAPAAAPSAVAATSAPGPRAPTERTVVIAFDLVTGHQLWRRAYAEDITDVAATSDALLVLHLRRPGLTKVEALQPRTGVRRWLAAPVDGALLTQNLAASPIDVTLNGRVARALSASTGELLWTSPTMADSAFTAGSTAYLVRVAPPKHPHRGN
jgi:outer membrane protein assembly factor BamB